MTQGAPLIHPTAIIHPSAQLDSSVHVGPYAVIGEHVNIAAGCRIAAHVVIDGHTTLGKDNTVFPFASLGLAPQDKKYQGEATQLIIGSGNTIREFVTFNTGTVQDQGVTRIGDGNWIMAYVHIAHDCQVGSHTILANNASLAGHVILEDHVLLGGFSVVHQFCRIGAHVMAASRAAITQDVPPFIRVAGDRASPVGINSEGLRRRGLSSEQIMAIKRGYRLIYRSNLSLTAAQTALLAEADRSPDAASYLHRLHTFISSPSSRGIIR